MEKVFTVYAMESEIELVEGVIEKYRYAISDSDKSKLFHIQGYGVILYHIVCEEETFEKIQAEVFGLRIY